MVNVTMEFVVVVVENVSNSCLNGTCPNGELCIDGNALGGGTCTSNSDCIPPDVCQGSQGCTIIPFTIGWVRVAILHLIVVTHKQEQVQMFHLKGHISFQIHQCILFIQ